jgi:hypothetical protein
MVRIELLDPHWADSFRSAPSSLVKARSILQALSECAAADAAQAIHRAGAGYLRRNPTRTVGHLGRRKSAEIVLLEVHHNVRVSLAVDPRDPDTVLFFAFLSDHSKNQRDYDRMDAHLHAAELAVERQQHGRARPAPAPVAANGSAQSPKNSNRPKRR